MKSINPTTGKVVKEYVPYSQKQVDEILEKSHTAYLSWRKTSFQERESLLLKLKDQILQNLDKLAALATEEMGKPLSQAKAEVKKCTTICDYYAKNAAEFLKPTPIEAAEGQGYVSYQPLGVILGIMPWNYPYWQVFRFALPALMAGNTTLLKHASNVTGCALAIEELFKKAGFPKDIFRTLLVDHDMLEPVIADCRVQGVSLTGSVAAGKVVAEQAGRYLKKCVFELGGSDAYIILEDADLVLAVEACFQGRLQNTGQSCIAAKRFIVVEKIRQKFEQMMLEKFEEVTFGDPLTDNHFLGPLARHDLRDKLDFQVAKSMDEGAHLLIGGYVPDDPGAYYPATILTDVKRGMTAYKEELFGPVASIIPVKDEKEAIEVANDSVFGLGGAVFTSNREKGQEIAEFKLEAGGCFVNNTVHSDARFPFGGIKESGHGRELSQFGLKEFVNIKTVRVW